MVPNSLSSEFLQYLKDHSNSRVSILMLSSLHKEKGVGSGSITRANSGSTHEGRVMGFMEKTKQMLYTGILTGKSKQIIISVIEHSAHLGLLLKSSY